MRTTAELGIELSDAFDEALEKLIKDNTTLEIGDEVRVDKTGSVGRIVGAIDEPDYTGEDIAVLIPESKMNGRRVLVTYSKDNLTKLDKKDVKELDIGDVVKGKNGEVTIESQLFHDDIRDNYFYIASYNDSDARRENCRYRYEYIKNITDLPYKE